MGKNSGKRYTEEFEKIIVELYTQGRNKKNLLIKYGLSTNPIRKWVMRERKEISEVQG